MNLHPHRYKLGHDIASGGGNHVTGGGVGPFPLQRHVVNVKSDVEEGPPAKGAVDDVQHERTKLGDSEPGTCCNASGGDDEAWVHPTYADGSWHAVCGQR